MKFNYTTLLVLFFLSSASFSEASNNLVENSVSFETSNYISNNIAEIPVVIVEDNFTINIINAASADKIVLLLKLDQEKQISSLKIKCVSQCGIEFADGVDKLQIKNLELMNAHLLSNSKLRVENISIFSSEAITTGLPVVTNKAEIKIAESKEMLSVQELLKAVNIIPGSGEYVYDVKAVYDEHGNAINSHNEEKIADALYNLQNLTRILPNLKWAAPVVSWFGVVNSEDKSSMDVANIEIVPGVEYRDIKPSEEWYVGGYDRKTAHLISRDENNSPNYGGSINDESLLRYIEALNDHKLKVMFYPMIGMDTPGKPWRGYIKADNPKDIHNFFTKKRGYNEFILHYAHLLKGKVDAFVIGSEMQELTQSVDNNYNYPDPRRYPAVVEFIDLARQVKEIMGNKVILTYAANWGEYHHDKEAFHHLDPLWASEYIDVVGIDAYLPITNKSMGDISIEEIKEGWESGELWDYYYDRNKKSDIMPEWGLKRIEYWWKNEHWSHGIKSQWVPKMKPIWFTEFGFPSMHMATNTPNVFWNPKAVNGGVPKRSSGKPDFAIQMRAIKATLEYWQQREDIVQNMFLWAWDARPFPYDAKKLHIWADSDLWQRGHWINSKIEALSQVALLPDFTVNILEVDADELIIEGSAGATQILAKNVQYIENKPRWKLILDYLKAKLLPN